MVAFAREHNNQVAIVAVPRLSYTLAGGAMRAPLAELWEKLSCRFHRDARSSWKMFSPEKRSGSLPQRTLLCREVFAHFPVALLVSS